MRPSPPYGESRAAPAKNLIWRHEATPMWRELSAEEAMMGGRGRRGAACCQLCVMLATIDDPDTVAGRAAGLLGGWIDAGLPAEARVAPP